VQFEEDGENNLLIALLVFVVILSVSLANFCVTCRRSVLTSGFFLLLDPDIALPPPIVPKPALAPTPCHHVTKLVSLLSSMRIK
jgi:hypothetical protein